MKNTFQFLLDSTDAFDKAPVDNPTIGLLLCKTKNHLVAEYALSGIGKPIGIAEYQLVRALPEPLDTCLPSIERNRSGAGTDRRGATEKANPHPSLAKRRITPTFRP